MQPGNLEGLHVKVGVASAGEEGRFYYLSSQREAIQTFGSGPLVDALVDSFSSGARIIYAMRAAASVPGSIGGSVSLWVECVKPGECGIAQIRYSLDGGVSFGGKVTVPENGKVEIASRNITLSFSTTRTVEIPAEPSEDEEGQAGSPTIQQQKTALTGGDLWKFSVDTATGSASSRGTAVTGTAALEVTAKKTAVIKNGSGTGTVTVGGSPLVNAEVLVEITAGGEANVATYRYSLDGGDNYSGNITVPEEQTEIVGTGIMLTFEGSFEAGDVWQFNANAPRMSNGDLIECLELLNEASIEYEFIHVVGEADRSVWAACQSMADVMFQKHRFIFMLCEARKQNVRESVDEWVSSLVEDAGKFAGMRVAVCAGRAEIVDMNTGYSVDRNCAGIVAGLLSKTPVQRSVGSVMYNPASLALDINPYPQFREAHIIAFDSARFITLRRYIGLAGIYVTNGRTMAENASDFMWLEYLRVVNKACRLVRTSLLKCLHSEVDEAGLRFLKAQGSQPLEIMRKAGEINNFRFEIPGDQDIIATSEVVTEIAIEPKPNVRWIKLAIGLENPKLREMLSAAS